jgi:dipeptidyl aminopeptidase/acylaminoacyl peptidase
MKKYSACCIALAFLCFAARGAGKHPFNGDDWTALRSAQAIAVSPDGHTILYRVSYGVLKGPMKEEWRLIAADGKDSRELKLPEHFSPLGFTRDGSGLYGPFEQNKKKQLAIISLAGHDAKPTILTAIPSGIGTAAISPDGSRFAVVADPRPVDELGEIHTVVENDASSLFVVNADATGGAWWCPSFTQIAGMAWAQDGTSVAIVSQTPMIGYHFVHSTIEVCSASGARHVADISNSAASEIATGSGGIAWTNGGKELAFLSTTSNTLTPDHVWTVSADGGTPMDRTPQLQGSAMGLGGDAHGRVWVEVARGVRGEVDSFNGGELKTAYQWPGGIVGATPVSSEIRSGADALAFSVADPEHATNVAVVNGGELKKITQEGDEQLASVALGPVQVIHWTSKEGIQLEGIATFPDGYVAGKQYPFLVFPHGGPESNDRLNFDAFARQIAGLGYVVLQPEYRGSTGYGTEFLEAIYQHFGDRAYSDVDSATDYAIEQGWADPNRLAIFGWSAGGFMTSWTVTQTHRYRAAIEGAGITDWLSFIWTSDVQQIDYDARWPEENPEVFLRYSAVMHAANVTTPLLILHGAADARVPTYQGREYYLALAARGKTVRMVTYPGSPHFPTLWEQRRDVFREVAAWLARYNP